MHDYTDRELGLEPECRNAATDDCPQWESGHRGQTHTRHSSLCEVCMARTLREHWESPDLIDSMGAAEGMELGAVMQRVMADPDFVGLVARAIRDENSEARCQRAAAREVA